MPAERTTRTGAPAPASQLHVAGHGFVVAGPEGLALQVSQFDADVMDLAPEAERAILPGGYNLQIRRAEVRVDATSLSHFFSRKVPSAKDLTVSFEAPDCVTFTGRLGNAPFRVTGRLIVSAGRLGFQPTRVMGPAEGLNAELSVQTGRVSGTISEKELLARLTPKFGAVGIDHLTLALQAGGLVSGSAIKQLAGKPAKVSVAAHVSTTSDGKIDLRGQRLHVSWDGLEADADITKGQGHLATTDVAVNRWIERTLSGADVRAVTVSVKPGNRLEATMQVNDGHAWRPLTMAGQLDISDGAVRVTPNRVSIQSYAGGVDAEVDPRNGRGRAVISEATLNTQLASVLSQNGIQHGRFRLLGHNQFELTGAKVDGATGQVQPLLVRGHMTLTGPDAIRLTPEHLQMGGRSIDMDSLGAGILHLFGWHLDHEINLNSSIAVMDGDSLVVHPSRLPKPLAGQLDSLAIENGRLMVTGKFSATLQDIWKRPRHLELKGNTLLLRPQGLNSHLAGRATSITTGNGTLNVDATLTPADWQRMIAVRMPGVVMQGDHALLDLGRLAGLGNVKVVSVQTGSGEATVDLHGDPSNFASQAPVMPGMKREGTTWIFDLKSAGLPWVGPVSAVRSDREGVTIDIGEPGPIESGSGLEGRLAGRLTFKGVSVEDAVVRLALSPNAGPISLNKMPLTKLRIDAARATIPTAKLGELLGQYVPAEKLGGYKVSWSGNALALTGRALGQGVTGKLVPTAGDGKGLALTPSKFHWGIFPVPAWLAARLLAGRLGGVAEKGKVYLDVGSMAAVELGPITDLTVAPEFIRVTIGHPAKSVLSNTLDAAKSRQEF